MSALEDRLHDALTGVGDSRAPAPDLFARVVDGIEHDRHRRRRVRLLGASWVVGLALATTLVLTLTPRGERGLEMPWWVLEVATNLVLLGIALWLGPFIKRFGRAYAADVFHDNPLTGKSYIVLTDIVYYLIFAAYILFSLHVAPQGEWKNDITERVTAEQVTFELSRLGGILLVIGILHGVNIVLMPVLGRLFSLNRRLPERSH
ncbi:hypothetical protein [Phycicoccus sp. 3266]|jgi:hypothetical protein|uniref:hypothetical protein n=1 Tax=Phycicoccus sp. 3266 TaxID=2817751 RepID=UPI002866850C|nr:hypothetical protein [Phycicoccus sp. 3266]MDR6864114.1 hypothetical protein [Phycicoccus sp. 3266]